MNTGFVFCPKKMRRQHTSACWANCSTKCRVLETYERKLRKEIAEKQEDGIGKQTTFKYWED